MGDVLEVVHARHLIVFLEADDSTDHLIINRESLERVVRSRKQVQRRPYIPKFLDNRTYGKRHPLMI